MKKTNFSTRSLANLFRSFILIVCFLTSANSHARFADHSEAPEEVEFLNSEINIEKNGYFTEITEKQIKILNEKGRQNNGTTVITFIKDHYETEIVSAKTINQNGEEQIVDLKTIEVKPLASSEEGFDQKYQILISFPQLVVGSKIYIKSITKHIPIIDNNFFSTIYFGQSSYQKNTSITINSKIPDLQLKINDPTNVLDINKKKEQEIEVISIHQKEPLFFALSNEPFSFLQNLDKIPSVSISSLADYSKIGKTFLEGYEKVINVKLPPLLSEIAAKAKLITDENDQLDFITSSLAEKIRYMGSWQTIKGKYYPRSLDVVESSGFADCKEYSAMTSAILRELGYKSYVSFVERSYIYYKFSNTLPSVNDFNHAIVRAEGPSGKKYWIDPTNVVSYSRGIFLDISNRESLVLNPENPKIEFIPNINYKKSIIELNKNIVINGETSSESGNIILKGEKAIWLSGIEFFRSKQSVSELIMNDLSEYANPHVKKIEIPDLKSRIVKNIQIDFDFDKTIDYKITNLGEAIDASSMQEYWLQAFATYTGDVVGIMYLDSPYTKKRTITIKNFDANNLEHLNYNISNKWFDSSRKCYKKGKDTIIEHNISLKKSIIAPEEINSEEFKKIKKQIKQLIFHTILIKNK